MNYEEWQMKRKALGEKEIRERGLDPSRARTYIQVAITEQAIREVYDRCTDLESRLAVLEAKRGPGRPPKSDPEAA